MRRNIKIIHFAGRLSIALVIALVAYFVFYRPLQLNWGATTDEIKRPLPGDEIVARPKFNATRAVTIAASPEQIWPWLLQIGLKRAGWYSFDLLDNLARPSSEQIIPKFQNLKAGHLVPMSPDGKMGFWVKELLPPRSMLWWDKQGSLSWNWQLVPLATERTRLITRVRFDYKWFSPYILFDLLLDVGDLVMMRQSMLGIRDRAEGRQIKSMFAQSMELLVWIMAFAGFVAAEIKIVRKPEYLRPLIAAIFSAAVTILLVLWKPSLWLDILFTAGIWSAVQWASRSKLKSKAI